MLNFPDKKINGLDALLVQVLRVSSAAVSFCRIKPLSRQFCYFGAHGSGIDHAMSVYPENGQDNSLTW